MKKYSLGVGAILNWFKSRLNRYFFALLVLNLIFGFVCIHSLLESKRQDELTIQTMMGIYESLQDSTDHILIGQDDIQSELRKINEKLALIEDMQIE